MRMIIAGLLLGTSLLANPAAHAATTIDTGSFTLGWSDGYYPNLFDMTVLSDSGGTVTIALHHAGPLADAAAGSPDNFNPSQGGDLGFTQLATTVHAGYRITSLALSASVNGAMFVGMPDHCPGTWCSVSPGYAENSGSFEWSLTQGGVPTALPGARIDNLEGQATLAQQAAVALQGAATLDLYTRVDARALGTLQNISNGEISGYRDFSSDAYLSMGDIVLTVQVAPVPEPSTYAMLLGGLALAGAAARRRRDAAGKR
ncbi:putative secreted protein with PEP-CTERM sorting signal/MYXO-CTERM domain-containing protein [Pseudoduganella flava]|uniref:Putative secreted protein with PEP-CTERM sorting signal/MYXO-CTERM domain-containing protein n=1 Tax=Pseudoduganella flava TaxID=871742 RepID=A0A562PK14_9BURK|nr:PEPxxWA-CTERM sorting domain-containing protein [Pseudoduganella flava]TWI44802.1 putative secreted protein with PEP-CTERM sorting signal/MYXO-CTERM domain-containing protein [Pseudoduganella flava]